MSNVRIFKLISGEMVIGKLANDDDEETSLRDMDAFEIESPFLLQYGPNGPGLAPMFPWVKPDSGASATFTGNHVMAEAFVQETAHKGFVDAYTQITSTIALAVPGNVASIVKGR